MTTYRFNSQTYPASLGSNAVVLLLLGMLLDGGSVSTPGSYACVAGIMAATYRALYVKITNKRVMVSPFEHHAWITLPFYVVPLFIMLFHLGSYLRYGS